MTLECKGKVSELESQVKTLQAQNEDLKKFIQREQEAHKQELIVREKQTERTLEKIKQTQLKESGLRIVEAEEAIKEAEQKNQKEVKRMQKQSDKAIDEMTKTH